jgi:hypothetical protein
VSRSFVHRLRKQGMRAADRARRQAVIAHASVPLFDVRGAEPLQLDVADPADLFARQLRAALRRLRRDRAAGPPQRDPLGDELADRDCRPINMLMPIDGAKQLAQPALCR